MLFVYGLPIELSINSLTYMTSIKGDFENIYRIYYPKMLVFAKNYIPADEDAENIVQDVFLKLWEDDREI